MRTFAEKSVVQTREFCEHSLEAVFESWERFVDAGQGALALNRKAIDIARRNINSGFGLAVSLAGRRTSLRLWNCRQPIGASSLANWRPKPGEMRTLATKVTADVAAPIKAQVTRGMKVLHKAT